MEVDPTGHDLKLYNSLDNKPYKRELRRGNIGRDTVVKFDHSLREFLTYAFLVPKMSITLLNKKIDSRNVMDQLIDVERVTFLPANTMTRAPPVTGVIGRSVKWELEEIGGAMLYASNSLITAFQRHDIGISVESEGWGIIIVVQPPVGPPPKGCGITTTQEKQKFEGSDAYLLLLQEMRKTYVEYTQRRENKIVPLSGNNLEKMEWVQCDSCNKWRRVTDALYAKYSGDTSFTCFKDDSPVMQQLLASGRVNCESTRKAACQAPQEKHLDDEMTQVVSSGLSSTY